MHIAFRFHYIHNNGLFTRLLNRLQEVSKLPLLLHHRGNDYTIEVSGGQEALEVLAEQVAALIPRSLFLSDYTVEEISAGIEQDNGKSAVLPEKPCSFQIPYCPECQKRVQETMDPFGFCRVCGFSEVSLSSEEMTAFTQFSGGITEERDERFFTKLASRLIREGTLTLPTYNGTRYFSLLGTEYNEEKHAILICDPIDISEKFLITEGELEALRMVEKPAVRLKPKLKFRSKYQLNGSFYSIFFADDKVTLALSIALKKRGISALFCDQAPSLRVAASPDQQVIVATGRDMLPWRYPLSLKSRAFCDYHGYQAFGDADGVQVGTNLEVEKEPSIRYCANGEHTTATHAIRFEPAHAALRSVALEQGLKDQALCGIYLSRQSRSQICSFSPKIGYTSMVHISDETLSGPKHLFEAIAAMDEGGMGLIDRYRKRFPELCERAEQIVFPGDAKVSAITRLWAMAAVTIGLSEESDPGKACEALESMAIDFGGKSGPRIDYKVISTASGYQLDPRVAIRSAISFKLAGVDDYLLSFGFVDSLADFIAEQAENADANIGISGVALSGSLFENRQLLARTYHAIRANYPLYTNTRLGLDDAIVAFGAIALGSE